MTTETTCERCMLESDNLYWVDFDDPIEAGCYDGWYCLDCLDDGGAWLPGVYNERRHEWVPFYRMHI